MKTRIHESNGLNNNATTRGGEKFLLCPGATQFFHKVSLMGGKKKIISGFLHAGMVS